MKDAIRECYSTVIRELAAIVNAPQTDDMLEKELLPRDPVMENVSRIREAMDKLSAAQHAAARGGGGDALREFIAAQSPLPADMAAFVSANWHKYADYPEPPTAAVECNRDCDCVGECKAGIERPTTEAGREDAVEYPD